MNLKIILPLVCLVMLSHFKVNSQDSLKTFIAKRGDGIINVLRSHGMNVTKYYEEFLVLNKGNFRKGSELHLGRTYYLPDAPDSFEQMGRKIEIVSKVESPIFTKDLFYIRKKDNSLEETVYYMVFDESKSNATTDSYAENYDVARDMAKELLRHGAKVYLIENAINEKIDLGEYIAIINRLYLKNNGKYQRLLVMNLNESARMISSKLTLAHYDKSKEGQKLAVNISKIFQNQNVLKKSSEAYTKVFNDKTNLYLAKNVMPAMTFIQTESDTSVVKNYQNSENTKISFSDIILKGILQDYTNLKFEEN